MRILIVEDEPLIAQRLERMCRELLGTVLKGVMHASRIDESENLLADASIDLLLLDLNLAGANGMEILKTSVAGSFHTVIVSAYTERAIEAYEFGVLDFVPKPFRRERLALALDRARGARGRSDHATKFLAARSHGRIELVRVDDVLYARGAGAYSELHLAGGRSILHDKSLERLTKVLPPIFNRIHKSYLVRLSEVVALHVKPGSRYTAELGNGLKLPIGRTGYAVLKNRLV
jgi:DNA-binding LytR/AlgR family response regulator